MAIVDIVRGKWLGHPLHPGVVHLIVALWPTAFIFDLLTYFNVGGNALVRGSFWAILIGLLVALVAVPTGLADFLTIPRDKPAWRLGLYHMMLNVLVAIIFALNLGLRINTQTTAVQVDIVPLTLSLIGTVILAVSGYLGGRMVYQYGIGVARFKQDPWRDMAQASGAHLPAES